MDNILKKADSIVYGEDNAKRQYGSASESFGRASVIASIMCGKDITPADIARIQIALKLSRESVNHKEDNLVDLCGYASILNDLNSSDLPGMENGSLTISGRQSGPNTKIRVCSECHCVQGAHDSNCSLFNT